MARAGDIFFNEHAGIAKVVLPEAADGLKSLRQLVGIVAHPHADPAAAGGAFEHYRIANLLRGAARLGAIGQQLGSFQQRQPLRFSQRPGGMLKTKGPQLLRRRADEYQSGGFAGFGEGGVFREETVAGVDRLGAALPRGGNDFLHHQIGLRRRAVAKAKRFIGFANMQAAEIGIGIDGDAFNLHIAQRAQNSAGDGATVGNK